MHNGQTHLLFKVVERVARVLYRMLEYSYHVGQRWHVAATFGQRYAVVQAVEGVAWTEAIFRHLFGRCSIGDDYADVAHLRDELTGQGRDSISNQIFKTVPAYVRWH